MKYQYIGEGEDSPKTINFMGQYKFTLNFHYVDVTDPEVLFKLENHPSFKVYVEPVKKAKKKSKKKAVKK